MCFLAIVTVVTILFLLTKKALFAIFMSLICKRINKRAHKYKQALFEPLNQRAKTSKTMLKVLEIGGGSGTNFEFVTQRVDWTVTEPNLSFTPFFHRNKQTFEHQHHINPLIQARGEDLSLFPAWTFDVVIMSMVLCSVDQIPKCLEEVLRVLKPEGQFYFMEHVGAPPGSWLRSCQDLLSAFVWPWLGEGCLLNKDTEQLIRSANFATCHIVPFILPDPALFMLQTCVHGLATKA